MALKPPADKFDIVDVEAFVEAARCSEQQQQHAALQAVIKVREKPPSLWVSNPRLNPAWIGTGTGAVAKVNRRGELKGWYRTGQKAGRPSRLLPVEKEMEAAFESWASDWRRVIPRAMKAKVLGQRSALARQRGSIADHILALRTELLKVHKTCIPTRIAQQLNCCVEYVRQVLRKNNNRS